MKTLSIHTADGDATLDSNSQVQDFIVFMKQVWESAGPDDWAKWHDARAVLKAIGGKKDIYRSRADAEVWVLPNGETLGVLSDGERIMAESCK